MVWFGHTGYTITALTIELSRDRETGDTVELTYEIPEGDALRSVPEMDSGIDVLSSVALSKAVITPGVAGVASVKLTYTKPKVEEEEDDSEGGENGSEEGEGSGEDGEGEEGSSPARTVSFTTSFDVTVVDQPILTHPKMASISGGQLEYLKAFMDGARLWELVPEVDNAGKPKLDSDGLPVMNQAPQSLLGSLSEVLIALRSIYPPQTDFFLPVPLHQKRKGVSISHTYATSRHALCKDQRAQYTIHHCNEPGHKRKKQRSL